MDDGITPSSKNGHKMQLEDLRSSLENLYDHGFSLVSLERWISGDLDVPEGRRPIVLTMDDLFFRNQILLGKDGEPDPETGIGVIWQFSKEHQDFGFHLSLFSILGDKYYPSDPAYDPDWEKEFAEVVVWLIEHDAMIYNHTYRHGYLGLVDNPVSMDTFMEQLKQNDMRLRELLAIADREDLTAKVDNILALPGGIPPQSQKDMDTLLSYRNPEGLPLQAIMHIYSAATDPIDLTYLLSPFSQEFDPFSIPRITGTLYYINYLIGHSDQFPIARYCELTLDENRIMEDSYLASQIEEAVQNKNCPSGIYFMDGRMFDATTLPVTLISHP